MQAGEEIARSFFVAGRDAAELFDEIEEALDEVAFGVEGFVIVKAGRLRMAQQARPKRSLGREGAPLGQRAGSSLFVGPASDEMALLIEMVVDLGVN